MGSQTQQDAFEVKAPYDSAELADIALRSFDGKYLFVSKIVLMRASPAFEQLLAVPPSPAPEDQADNDDWYNGLPVARACEPFETASALDALMRILEPSAGAPQVTDPQVWSGVVSFARKYEIPIALAFAEQALAKIVEVESNNGIKALAVFSVAAQHGMKDLMQSAALASLKNAYLGQATVLTKDLANRMADYRLRVITRIVSFMNNLNQILSGDEAAARFSPNPDFIDNAKIVIWCPESCANKRGEGSEAWPSLIWYRWEHRIIKGVVFMPLQVSALDTSIISQQEATNCRACCDRLTPSVISAINRSFTKQFLDLALGVSSTMLE